MANLPPAAQIVKDATGAAIGIQGPDGNRIPFAELQANSSANPIASKSLPSHFKYSRRALNTAVSGTFTTTPTAATEIYIDFNRGNDANPGTRASPKKNLSVLSNASFGAGSVIALASDSVWDIVATSATLGAVIVDSIKGTNGNPALITAYDPAGHTGTKPTIMYSYQPASNEWTWDATYHVWRWSAPAGINPAGDMCAFFGPSKLAGVSVWQDNTKGTLPYLFGDRQFGCRTDYSTYRYVYVWAPSNTDPTTYYGGVRLCLNARGLFTTGWQGFQYTTIDGLKFAYSSTGIYVNPNSGSGAHNGLVVQNCETDHAQLFKWYSDENAAHGFTIANNSGAETPGAFVHASESSNGGTVAYDIYGNSIKGCNRQYSAMAGVYIQVKTASLGSGKVHHNYIADGWNGVGTELNGMAGAALGGGYGSPFDGSAVYFDLGSNNGLAFGNIIERCHVAMQTNSAKTVQLIGNIAIDCNILSTSTDAGYVGSNDVTVAHNTYINRLSDTNQLKRGTTSDPRFGIANWYENPTASAIRVFNNALYRSAPVTGIDAIRVANEAGTKYVGGNAISGWAGGNTDHGGNVYALARDIDDSTRTDLTATGINVNGYTNPAQVGSTWFEGTTAVPAANSPLIKAGNRYTEGLYDLTGTPFPRIPGIGALVYTGA